MISIEEKAVRILADSLTESFMNENDFAVAFTAAISVLRVVWDRYNDADYTYVSVDDAYNEYVHLTQAAPEVKYKNVFNHASKL